MDVYFDHAEDVAKNIRTFWFRAHYKPEFTAGQFIELYLPHDNPDNRGSKRWFTLSSSPSENLLAITTKLSETNISTFKKQLFSLRPGATASISQPMGDFVLPKDKSIPLVFVAAGVGITPVRSIITWLSASNEHRNIQIIYGVKNQNEIAFSDLLENYGAKTDIVLSRSTPEWTGLIGKLDGNFVKMLLTDISEQLIYISGPEQFVEIMDRDLRNLGVPGNHLVLDYYHGYDSI